MEKLLPSPSARARPGQQCLSGSCCPGPARRLTLADAQAPPCLGEEAAVTRVRKGNTERRGPVYWEILQTVE